VGVQGIERLCGFDRFVNLEALYLNNNRLSDLAGLDACFRIKKLYADHNKLVTLEGPIEGMKFLTVLEVSHNKLADLDYQLETLRRCQYLKHLDLRDNPVSQEVNYRLRVIAAVPSLEVLDAHAIESTERIEAESFGSPSRPSTVGGGRRKGTFGLPMSPLSVTLTNTGRAMFGLHGDTLTQRTLAKEARTARAAAAQAKRAAMIGAIAAAGRDRGWAPTVRDARARGKGLGAMHSLLTHKDRGIAEDALVGSMLRRGCGADDTMRLGLGLLADLPVPSKDQALITAKGASRTAVDESLAVASESPKAASPAAGWSAARRLKEKVKSSSSLTNDLKALEGGTPKGSKSAKVSLLGTVGDALRRSRTAQTQRRLIGKQAMEASKSDRAVGDLGEWELQRLKRLFKHADADGSKSLSLDEFRKAIAEASDYGFVPVDASEDGVSRAEVEAAFHELDLSDDGKVQFPEFVALMRERVREHGPLPSREAFKGPTIRFRSLTKGEAESKAKAYFRTASGLHSRLLRMSADDPKRETITAQALDLSARGSLLQAFADRLGGVSDPPERPPPPPKPRRDFKTFTQSVPRREAEKTLQRGMRDYRVPPPGAESDSESDDDEFRQRGAQYDDLRALVRARKPHVILKTSVDL
jgi:hypothetical protein